MTRHHARPSRGKGGFPLSVTSSASRPQAAAVHAEEHAAHLLVQPIPDGVVQPDDPVLRKFLHLMAHAFPLGRDVRPVARHVPCGHGLALGVLHQQPTGPRGPAEGGDAFPEMFDAVRLLAETCQTREVLPHLFAREGLHGKEGLAVRLVEGGKGEDAVEHLRGQQSREPGGEKGTAGDPVVHVIRRHF